MIGAGGARWRRQIDVHGWANRSREFARRSKEAVLLAAVVGALTGLGVAGFDSAVARGVDAMNDLPLWLTAVAPFVGLSIAGLVLHFFGSRRIAVDRRRIPAHVP